MTNAKAERIGYLDSGRAILILLGVPYHASLIYHPLQFWLVHSPEVSAALGWLGDFLHYFRMHAFFLISGFFATLQLSRLGRATWLRQRLVRLGVPLVAAALLLNPIQMLGTAISRTDGWNAESLALWLEQLSSFGGQWIAHLWFLIVLMMYCIGAAALWPLIPEHQETRRTRRAWASVGTFALLALVFVGWRLAKGVILRVVDDGSVETESALILDHAVFYLPYFILGGVLERNREMLARFGNGGTFAAPFGIAAFVAAQLLWSQESLHMQVISRSLQGLASLLLCASLFHLLMHRLDGAGPRLRGITAAAFTIYLVHQPIIVWLGIGFGEIRLPPTVEFLAIAGAASAMAYAIHVWAVGRNSTLGFLFNGVLPKRRTPLAI